MCELFQGVGIMVVALISLVTSYFIIETIIRYFANTNSLQGQIDLETERNYNLTKRVKILEDKECQNKGEM